MFCAFHGYDVISHVCIDCSEVLCRQCLQVLSLQNSEHDTDQPIDLLAETKHQHHNVKSMIEAFDEKKQELESLLKCFKSYILQLKIKKSAKFNKLQTLQLDILRGKTVLERRTQSLQSCIESAQASYSTLATESLDPVINTYRDEHNHIEYDLVAAEGIIGAAESVSSIGKEKPSAFIKSMLSIKREMELMMGECEHIDNKDMECADKSVQENGDIQKDKTKKLSSEGENSNIDFCGDSPLTDTEKVSKLAQMNINFDAEKKQIQRLFTLPTKPPDCPRILHSWCVVGSDSLCLTWKCSLVNSAITSYTISYATKQRATQSHAYRHIKLTNITKRRNHAILLHLMPNTDYLVKIYSENSIGRSKEASAVFKTNSDLTGPSRNKSNRFMTFSICGFFNNCVDIFCDIFAMLWIFLYICLLFYFFAKYQHAFLCDNLSSGPQHLTVSDLCPHHLSSHTSNETKIVDNNLTFSDGYLHDTILWFGQVMQNMDVHFD